jgi:hypothetical protein
MSISGTENKTKKNKKRLILQLTINSLIISMPSKINTRIKNGASVIVSDQVQSAFRIIQSHQTCAFLVGRFIFRRL